MIQIYSPTNTDYSKNGNMVLFPESCEVHAKSRAEWYLDIEHPLDEEGRWKEIVEEAVISAPTFMGNNQLFRIIDTEKTDTEIKAKAYPIFFDSADELFIYSKTLAFVNGQTALNQLMAGSKYSGESNITRTSSAEFINRNLMDCLNGDSDPAFIRYWGGDVLYDNYKVIINERAGSNNGVQIRYRKNMEGIRCKVDMSNVVTRLVPIAYNGRRITGNYVDSPNVGKYAKVYTRLVEFPNVKLSADIEEGAEPEEGVTVCATQSALNTTLTRLCNELFAEGIDKPSVTLDVDMIDLSRTEEYKEFKDLEKVSLGDTVGVYHKDLDIDTEERCIELTWDCITNSAKKVVLGDYEYDYLIDGNKELRDKIREQYKQAAEEWKKKWEDLQKECEETYETKTDAQKGYEELQEYTNTQVSTGIENSEGNIKLFVSETYESKSEAEESYKELQSAISQTASSIRLSVSQIYETKNDAQESYENLQSSIDVALDAINLKVSKGEVSSQLSLESGQVTISGNRLVIDSTNFKVSKDGTVEANKGVIGGWTIGTNRLYVTGKNDDGATVYSSFNNSSGSNWAIAVGASSINYTQDAPFRVTHGGNLIAQKAFLDNLTVSEAPIVNLPAYNDVVSYDTNMYIGNTGILHRTTAVSSKTIKHDIEDIGTLESLDPKKLYDVRVVQFKYNDGVISNKKDSRYGKDMPGFIIEELNEVYPIVVDKPSEDVKNWSWNQRLMIPAMLKLIQELNKRLLMIERSVVANEG